MTTEGNVFTFFHAIMISTKLSPSVVADILNITDIQLQFYDVNHGFRGCGIEATVMMWSEL